METSDAKDPLFQALVQAVQGGSLQNYTDTLVPMIFAYAKDLWLSQYNDLDGTKRHVFYNNECTTFNGDSDVDEGEDELEFFENGLVGRSIVFHRSWVDGGGHSGFDVRRGQSSGIWTLSEDKKSINVEWSSGICHKGAQPSTFKIAPDGLKDPHWSGPRKYRPQAEKKLVT